MSDQFRSALLHADPALSRFDPLPRIIVYDDFDHGLRGWSPLIGNYEGALGTMLPEYRDLRGPMLSNLTVWDTGTDGSLAGTYALKLATRPRPDSLAVAIKRLTYRHRGPLRLEAYVTFKPEASELVLSETDVRSFGIVIDLQAPDGEAGTATAERVMPHLRYLNATDGQPETRWQFKQSRRTLHQMGASGKIQSHFHLGADGWEDIPGGRQLLCYNEIPTKQNWHYLRLDLDLATMSLHELQCNDRVFPLAGVSPLRMPAMANLWCMLNLLFFVQADTTKRAFLYVDSVLLSGDW